MSLNDIKIMAFDQSTETTGYSVFRNGELFRYGSYSADTKMDVISRIEFMYNNIKSLIASEHPDHIVFEGVQFQRNLKAYSELSWLQGAILSCVYNDELGFEIITPSEWRKHFDINKGKGVKRAELKARAINKVKELYGLEVAEDIAEAILIGRSVVERTMRKQEDKTE